MRPGTYVPAGGAVGLSVVTPEGRRLGRVGTDMAGPRRRGPVPPAVADGPDAGVPGTADPARPEIEFVVTTACLAALRRRRGAAARDRVLLVVSDRVGCAPAAAELVLADRCLLLHPSLADRVGRVGAVGRVEIVAARDVATRLPPVLVIEPAGAGSSPGTFHARPPRA